MIALLWIVAAYGCSSVASSSDSAAGVYGESKVSSCTTSFPQAAAGESKERYLIAPGDELLVSIYLSPEFDRDVIVQPDGKIDLQVAGPLRVAGLTPTQVSDEIDRAYKIELSDPRATVVVKSTPSRVVYVEGEVTRPGAVTLFPEMTAMGAISQAGGFTDSAGTDSVVLIRRDFCGNPQGERLDLGKVVAQKNYEEDAALLPLDIVVVPRSGIANVDLFVKQHIRDVLPVEPYLSIPGL